MQKAVEAYRERYSGFGPTFAEGKLAEAEGITISVSVLRRQLIAGGDWKGARHGKECRSRRERFGGLVQFDGSHHKRFEDRGPACCLMATVDGAANTRRSRFFERETMETIMAVFSCWIRAYGIPGALYCDSKNAFALTREPTGGELWAGVIEPKSHFGKACEKLGVTVIAASSPQAKGRVERNHGVDQDRLVKELRLAGISTTATEKALPNPKNKVLVRVRLDGSVSVIWKETKLLVKELTNIQDHKIHKAA